MNLDARGSAGLQDRSQHIDIEALAALAGKALRGEFLESRDVGGLTQRCETSLGLISTAVSASDEERAEAVRSLARFAREHGAEVAVALSDEAAPMGRHRHAELCQPTGDIPLAETEAGLGFTVAHGGRSRLWVKFSERADYWVHLLVKPKLFAGAEPAVALRYLHDNDAEQVIVRLRRSGLVLHKEVELPLLTGAPFFLSIGIIGGQARICVNGIPVYHRQARHELATSIMLDVIGISGGPTELLIPFLAVQPAGETCLGASAEDGELLATGFVEQANRSGSRSRLHEALHALVSSRLRYGPQSIREMTAAARNAARPFSDVLEDLLLARLSAGDRAEFFASRPRPILRARDVSITLSSNPSAKSVADLFWSREKKTIRIVENLSFDAFSGDIVGIIGRNGAGKTTFLKSLVGAIPISSGRIDIEERPILLRPGAGMQPDLTGRQNIYKTGLYMDMTMREIGTMIDDVIRFAELEDHIDRPFKYYSDGMRARLIFSMATAMPRDILLLDELLSAGDMGFQERAMNRLNQFLSHAKLVFVVQHTFDFVLTRCTKCLLLEKGVPVYFGEPRIATELYRELL